MAKKSITQIIQEKFPESDPAKVIATAIQRNSGSLTMAAKELGVSHSGIWRYVHTQKVVM